jgi:hypothetical protein
LADRRGLRGLARDHVGWVDARGAALTPNDPEAAAYLPGDIL